jgi:hypothetical protein
MNCGCASRAATIFGQCPRFILARCEFESRAIGAQNHQILAHDRRLARAPALVSRHPGRRVPRPRAKRAEAILPVLVAKPKAPGLWPEKTKTRLLAQIATGRPLCYPAEDGCQPAGSLPMAGLEEAGYSGFRRRFAKMLKTPPRCFAHLRVIEAACKRLFQRPTCAESPCSPNSQCRSTN